MSSRTVSKLAWAPLTLALLAGAGGGTTEAAARTKAAAHSPSKHGKPAAKKLSRSSGRGHGKGNRRKKREPPPQMPSQITLTAIELTGGTAHVDVTGVTHPPATRLFLFTDHNGRRFVPSFAECHPPPGVSVPGPGPTAPAAGEEGGDEDADAPADKVTLPASTHWRCTLTIPRLYRRAPLTGLAMEWGSLAVAANPQTVQRLWGEARAAAPLSAIAERPHDAPSPPADPTPPPSAREPEGPGADDDEPGDPSDN